RQHRLVDNADAGAVALDPDTARLFAVDFHVPQIAMFPGGAKPDSFCVQRKCRENAMATIDYEKEYDNRGRVPEHPEIFARWARETEAYRKAASGAELAIAYGPSPRQTIDIFPAAGGGKAPLAMFIHGGWWRSLDPSMF